MSRTLIQEGLRALSEQEFIKNIIKKEPQSSGDFLANYVTSGQAGRNVYVPGKDLSQMNPLEKIKYIRKAQKFMNNPSLDKPIPGTRAPGSGGSPVDDPTGQFGRPGLPGGQTAQSSNDLTYRDYFIADPNDRRNILDITKGRENIERRKQDLVDVYGPDVDKGSRRVSAEREREYQKSLDARRNSTLSQNNIYPPDTRTPIKKAGDRLNRFLGRGGNLYDSPSQKDPTTILYRQF